MPRPPTTKCSKRYSTALCVGTVLFYIGFQLLHGDNGLIGRGIEQRKQEALTLQLEQTRMERMHVEHNIALISGSQIDADLLDELARAQLPMAGEGEIVVLVK